jgi:hypothetical protein
MAAFFFRAESGDKSGEVSNSPWSVTDETVLDTASGSKMNRAEQIKRLAIVAMVSDDELMDRIVLKGGNALDLVYGVAPRSSLDLDFSVEGEFVITEALTQRIRDNFTRVFSAKGLAVFDFALTRRPETRHKRLPRFWGGYQIAFKVIDAAKYQNKDERKLRMDAEVVGAGQLRTFTVDISPYENCSGKAECQFELYTLYVYSPQMIVAEKLRAICQQMPEYGQLIGVTKSAARARDFFDIHTCVEQFGIDLTTEQNILLLREVFKAKEVPVELLAKIGNFRQFHKSDFASLRDTLKPGQRLRDYDFYFDYVLAQAKAILEAFGVV